MKHQANRISLAVVVFDYEYSFGIADRKTRSAHVAGRLGSARRWRG
jgi:hypothetical protein